jgi:hypothetical protein
MELATAIATAVILGVGLAGVASYFVWSRRAPATSETSANQSSDSFVRSIVGLANASLASKNYRAALSYADEVLRASPDQPDALRVREMASSMLKNFDDAIARGSQALAARDLDGAANALNAAREIDPTATAVADLDSRLNQARAQADAARREPAPPRPTPVAPAQPPKRTPVEPTRTEPSRRAEAVTPPPVREEPPAPTPVQAAPSVTPAPTPAPPPQTPPAPVNPPAAQTPAPPAARPAPTPEQPAQRPEPDPSERREPPPAARTESDDAVIRRVVNNYARAIESKDIGLYRSLKPNMSREEQRRIEDGFRTVTSQQVAVTILSIEVHGAEATVRLRRRDTIQAGGREQTAESQQTMTLTRAASGWVIREIGR